EAGPPLAPGNRGGGGRFHFSVLHREITNSISNGFFASVASRRASAKSRRGLFGGRVVRSSSSATGTSVTFPQVLQRRRAVPSSLRGILTILSLMAAFLSSASSLSRLAVRQLLPVSQEPDPSTRTSATSWEWWVDRRARPRPQRGRMVSRDGA